jgi:hypothetical protein
MCEYVSFSKISTVNGRNKFQAAAIGNAARSRKPIMRMPAAPSWPDVARFVAEFALGSIEIDKSEESRQTK